MTFLRRAAPVAVALALLSGCTGAPAATSPSPPVPATASGDTNPTDPERLSDRGSFRAAITTLPATWNPWHPRADADTQRVLDPLRARAFVLDSAGRAVGDPDYVDDAEVTHDERTTVTLHLNPRAVWGDGEPVTAADWVATWRALGSGEVVPPVDGWDTVADVRQGDTASDVVLTYRGVEPDWTRPLTGGVARAGSLADAAAFDDWGTFRRGWFAGPFVVEHVDRAQGLVTMVPNPRWWGASPRLDHLYFRTLPTEAVAAAFQNNELDVLEVGLSTDLVEQARAAGDAVLRTTPGATARHLRFDLDGPLGDDATRLAVLRAVDPADLATHDLSALADHAPTWANHLLLTTQPGYSDQAQATGLVHDAEAAAVALTEAGWTLVGSRRVRGGTPLALTVATDPDDAASLREADRLGAMLEPLGVDVTAVRSGEADIVPDRVTVTAYPLADVRTRYGRDPRLGDLPERIATETDPVRRADLATQAARLLWQSGHTLPLYQEPQVVAVKGALANVGAPGHASTQWERVGWVR